MTQDNLFYKFWNVLKLINCLISTLIYPNYTVNGFPYIKDGTSKFWFLVCLETFFGLDIALNFFIQEIDDRGLSQNLPLFDVAQNYFTGAFLFDLVCFLPLGFLFSLIDPRLKFMWLIKTFRLKSLKFYLSQKFFDQWIVGYIEYKQSHSLHDEEKKYSTNQDLNYITRKIYVKYWVKLLRIVLIILLITYFVGQYWIIYV